MSWATCYSGSNNIHFNFPPLVEDGREFMNFDPAGDSNKILRERAGISNNFEYRKFLINNGLEIMKSNFRNSKQSSLVPIFESPDAGNKYVFTSPSDTHVPFGYEDSDLKRLYLTKHALNNKLRGPFIQTNDGAIPK